MNQQFVGGLTRRAYMVFMWGLACLALVVVLGPAISAKAPQVRRVAPEAHVVVDVGETVAFVVEARDSMNHLNRTLFLLDGKLTSVDYCTHPCSFDVARWTHRFQEAGRFAVYAEARDISGGRSNGIDWVVHVGDSSEAPPSMPPEVRLLSPDSEHEAAVGASLSFEAEATDSDANLASVVFYLGNSLANRSDCLSPCMRHVALWNHSFLEAGIYYVWVRAVDERGQWSEWLAWAIAVPETGTAGSGPVPENRAPSLVGLEPANDARVPAGTQIQFKVRAQDPDADLREIRFYVDSSEVGRFDCRESCGLMESAWSSDFSGEGARVVAAVARDVGGLESGWVVWNITSSLPVPESSPEPQSPPSGESGRPTTAPPVPSAPAGPEEIGDDSSNLRSPLGAELSATSTSPPTGTVDADGSGVPDINYRFERPNLLWIELNAPLHEYWARTVRAQADGNGDRNGFATEAEVAAVESSFGVISVDWLARTAGPLVRVDGLGPVSVSAHGHSLVDGAGSIESGSGVHWRALFLAAFPVLPAQSHRLTLVVQRVADLNPPPFDTEVVRVRAPEGYEFDGASPGPKSALLSTHSSELSLSVGRGVREEPFHTILRREQVGTVSTPSTSLPSLVTLWLVGSFWRRRTLARKPGRGYPHEDGDFVSKSPDSDWSLLPRANEGAASCNAAVLATSKANPAPRIQAPESSAPVGTPTSTLPSARRGKGEPPVVRWDFQRGHQRIAAAAVLATVISVLALPSATARSELEVHGVFAFTNHSELRITLNGTIYGSEARALRMRADASGNGDGDVSASELENMTRLYASTVNASARQLGTPGGRILVNGTTFSLLTVEHVSYPGAGGPVNSTEHVEQILIFRVRFPARESVVFSVKFETTFRERGGSYGLNITTATLQAPPGYRLDPTRGFPSNALLAADGRSIELLSGLNPAVDPFAVVMTKEEAGGAVAPNVGLLHAGLLVGIVGTMGNKWARRRRIDFRSRLTPPTPVPTCR